MTDDPICGYKKTDEAIWVCWLPPTHSGPHVSFIGPEGRWLGVALYDDNGQPVPDVLETSDEELVEAVDRYLYTVHNETL